MTTADELRLALSQAVADPPPIGDDLAAVLARPARRSHRTRNRLVAGAFAVGVGGAAIAAFSAHGPEEARSGLGRYTPAAVAAARRDGGHTAELPDSNAQVIVVMEVRYDCQGIYRYLASDQSAADAHELRARLTSSERVAGDDVTAFTDYARSRLRAERSGSAGSLASFASSECPPEDALRGPIRKGGSDHGG